MVPAGSPTRVLKYTAFITYSHADTKVAAWLQKGLETYKLPAELARSGESRRLGRFFRDREELPAGSDLSQSVREALRDSAFLIVVCSPSAARSLWVNREIEEFIAARSRQQILCMIVGGEPFASSVLGEEDKECFPPSLGYRVDRNRSRAESRATEPIAADLRPGRDGQRLAKLKIVSGLLGVGLDTLVQRDAQRRQRRMLGVSLASLAGMLLMGLLSIAALDARNDERLRRAEAEDLIEFMLGDLRNRLDAVGRLDVLDAVGEKAVEYYSRVDLGEHADAALGRRARALHLLGEVNDLRGNMRAAHAAFAEAYETTAELVRRSPGEGQLIFDHAQSVFWVGYFDWRLGNLAEAERAFVEYLSLANELGELDSANIAWRVEAGYANQNLGVYALDAGSPPDAIAYFERALSIFLEAARAEADNLEWQSQVAQCHAWLADAFEDQSDLRRARDERAAEADIYARLLARDSANRDVQLSLVNSYRARAEISMQLGNVDSAIDDLMAAKRYSDELVELEPENGLSVQFRASVYANLAEARAHAADAAGALALFEQAERFAAELEQRDASVIDWRQLRFRVALQRLRYLASDARASGPDLLTELSRTAQGLEQLRSEAPQLSEIPHLLAQAHFLMAGLLVTEERRDHIETVIAVLAPLETSLPPRMLAILALAHRARGDAADAARLASQLRSIGFDHPGYAL